MTIVEMLRQSAILTFPGMTVVFVFLWIMIICVNAAGKLIHGMGRDKDIQQPEPLSPKTANGRVSAEVTAVITAAVTEYRKK
jgi:oxaloacetate decarboxylase gamma subunit